MSHPYLITADLIAVSILAIVLYFPRHGRRDIVVAILGLNVGVMAVATALAEAAVTAGVGLGLFAVLSIIRLRSSELEQEEIAYYFTALAVGLLGGIPIDPDWLTPVLMVSILGVMFVGDHPRLLPGNHRYLMTLDEAFTDEKLLRNELETILGARVKSMRVKRVNLAAGRTVVDVRFSKRDTDLAE